MDASGGKEREYRSRATANREPEAGVQRAEMVFQSEEWRSVAGREASFG